MYQDSPRVLFFEPPIFVRTDTTFIHPSPNLIAICNKNNLQPLPSIWQQFEVTCYTIVVRRVV